VNVTGRAAVQAAAVNDMPPGEGNDVIANALPHIRNPINRHINVNDENDNGQEAPRPVNDYDEGNDNDTAVPIRTNRLLSQLLDPQSQVELMQLSARVERNNEMLRIYTLLQRNRIDLKICGQPDMSDSYYDLQTVVQWFRSTHVTASMKAVTGNRTIYNMSKPKPYKPCSSGILAHETSSTIPFCFTDISTQALIQTMMLPLPIIQMITLYIPVPKLWNERIERLHSSTCFVNPNAAVVQAFDIIDEVLEEGGFLSACELAHVPAPIPFATWSDWKRSSSSIPYQGYEDSSRSISRRLNVTEAIPPEPQDKDNPTITEMRRQVGYLPLLNQYQLQTDIVSILLEAPYRLPLKLMNQLLRTADIASICRRCCILPTQTHTLTTIPPTNDKHAINFEANAAMDILMLASRLCSWYWRERHIERSQL
jgi:hypothetical protein